MSSLVSILTRFYSLSAKTESHYRIQTYTIATMDDEARQALANMKMPRRPINFVPAKEGEILKLGHITCRIMEDGSRTGLPTLESSIRTILTKRRQPHRQRRIHPPTQHRRPTRTLARNA